MSKKIGKLRYDDKIKSILGIGYFGNTVFSGFFKRSLFGSDNPVGVKRIQRSDDVSLKEVEIMKKITDGPNTLRLIHMEKTSDFL